MGLVEAAEWGWLYTEVGSEHWPALCAWVCSGAYVAEGRRDLPSVSDFEERYCGRWEDFREYAENWATETGMTDRWPDDAVRYINWDAWIRDMTMDHTVVNAPAPHFGVFVFRDLWHKTPAAIGCGGLLSGSPPSVLVSDPTTAKPEKSSEAAHSREHRQRDQRLMLPDLGSRERRPHSAEQWPKTKRMCDGHRETPEHKQRCGQREQREAHASNGGPEALPSRADRRRSAPLTPASTSSALATTRSTSWAAATVR